MSRIDLVIFGATGFTGKHAVEKMVSFAKKYPGITWAVAGRSEKKLQALMEEISAITGEDLFKVKIIIADIDDEKSLKVMCSQAKVLVNCCGPYWLYGEPVVLAAIDSKSHYVDVTAEPQFMDTMQLRYDSLAKNVGVYVITACGYDCIPNDMGVIYLQQNFGGTLNSVESYISILATPEAWKEKSNGFIHYGTWESLIYGFFHYFDLKQLRQKIYPNKLPNFKPTLKSRPIIHKHGKQWCFPFLGADKSVVYRGQRYFYEEDGQRPVQFKVYVGFPKLWLTALLLVIMAVMFIVTKFTFMRNILLRHPRFFSNGIITRESPSKAAMEGFHFAMTLYGEGWEEGSDIDATPPNKKVVAKVSGTNPGYGATVVALLLSAITIVKEQDKMPGKGGVLTTAVAFRKTNLIKNLHENDLKFEIVESTSI